MSNTKTYVGNTKDIEGKFGTIQKISYSRKDLETMMANLNEKDYVNLNRLPKKETDQWGNTHYMVIDTYIAPPKETESKPERKTAADNYNKDLKAKDAQERFENDFPIPF
jgi:bisphosphoglycerate-dependent phosphoglycerate mutase